MASARMMRLFRGLLAVAMCVLSVVYVGRTWPDVVWQDGFFIVDHLRSLADSGWSVSGAVPVYYEHLLPVWLGITWANARVLSLDMRLDSLMFVLTYVGHFLLLSRCICKEERALSDVGAIVAVTVLGGLCFSLVQPPVVLRSCQFALATRCGRWAAVGLTVAWLGDSSLRQLWKFALAAFLYFTMSGAYFPGFLLGIAGVLLWHKVVGRQRWAALLAAAAVVLGMTLLYAALLVLRKGEVSGGAGPLAPLVRLLDIPTTCAWILTGIGASVVDMYTAEERLQPLWLPVMGGVLATLAVVLLYYAGRTSSRRVSPILLYCLLYPIGVILAVRVGRGHCGGPAWIANTWYAFHMKFFVIGTFWLIWKCLREPAPRMLKAGAATAAALLVVLIAFSNYSRWQRSPHVYAWMKEKQAAMRWEPSDKRAAVLAWDRPAVDRGLEFLAKRGWNAFAQRDALNAEDEVRVVGWSDDGFIGPSASCRLNLTTPTQIILTAWCPPYIEKNTFSLRVDKGGGQSQVVEILAEEAKTIELQLPIGQHDLSMQCAVAKCPAKIGINSDQRDLSLVLKMNAMRKCALYPRDSGH